MKLKLSHGRSSLHSVLTSTMAYVVVVATMSAMMMHVPTIAALNCPQGAGTITISGDSDSMYAVKGWKEVFEVNCPHYTVDAQTEAALDVGIRQACHADDVVPPVDIGGRSREFDDNDDLQPQPVTVSSSNEFTFTCNDAAAADKELVQILVAHDALAFVVLRDTFAERCLQSLPGHGLTLDQLRWIYSSYTEEQLVATGWNASSVPNSDHNNAQRKWEALGGTRCFNGVINVTGVQSMQDYFLKHSILPDWKNGETLRSDFYHDTNANNVLAHLQSQQNALGVFWYGSVADKPQELFAGALQNRQTHEYVFPTPNGIASQAYPLSRQIYLNVNADPAVLTKVAPFFEYGYTQAGDDALKSWQFVPTTPIEKSVMRARLGSELAVKPHHAHCGRHTNGELVLAGAAAMSPLAGVWGGVYHVLCQESIQVVVDGGDAAEGARRVCNQHLQDGESAVDIGEMDRDWLRNEATTHNGWTYDCKASDRNVVQVQVAVESLTVVTAREGPAHRCITKLKGLSLQQVRWIYSSLTDEVLKTQPNGYVPPHTDHNDTTHWFSELLNDPACAAMEILLAGPDDRNAGYHFMSDTIFNRTIGETFSETRDLTSPLSTGYSYYPANSAEDLTKYVTTNGDAIGFMTSNEVAKHRGVLYEVPIMISEHMIAPDPLNIFDGRYPLMRSVYMNLYNEPNSLKYTQPFIEFGLSDEGQSLAEYAGYTRLANPLRTVMHTRAQTAFGVSTRAIEQTQKMGCATHNIKGSGAAPAIRLVDYWSGIYEVACGISFHSTTVGSQYGAARVCAEPGAGAAVEVALMSRPVLANEATPRDGSADGTVYDCVKGDKSRSLLQAHIASDGMAFAVKKGGMAFDCINLLGGLSMDQIRWMFSSLSEEELVAEGGWEADAIPNSDNDPKTHKWSELHADCAHSEIHVAGLNVGSSAFTFFADIVFKADKESPASARNYPYFSDKEDHEVALYVEKNSDAIGFFSSFIYTEVALNQDDFAVVPIKNRAGNFVRPTSRTVNDGTYDHFAIPLYMLILNQPDVVKNIIPFLQFAFSEDGTELVESAGYGPISAAQIKEIMEFLRKFAGEGSGDGGLSAGAASGIAIATLAVAMLVGYFAKRKASSWVARKDVQTTNNMAAFNASAPYSDNPYSDDPEESGDIPDAMLT